MPPSFQWNQVSELLDEVMALPSAERAPYLAGACPDRNLRDYLHSLILSYDDSGTFLERSPALPFSESWTAADASPPSCLGRRIGPYQLIEEIGAGGMGIVYRAVRADDHYLKSVAIKLMKADFSSQFSLMRFRVERQVMASLDHPNIARLLDGGTTGDGMPYLVMELIDGLPLDLYCDRHRLSITQRLELFRTACSAVQYAHQHLVIHRDLKPANVLVTEGRIVKLLDFGIAKILDPGSFPEVVDPTVPLLRLLSPDYASPEQVRGELVTTASDVYSLGVLLYQLLTGHKPYTCDARNLPNLTSLICDTEPPRPSSTIGRASDVRRPSDDSSSLTAEAVSSSRDTQPGKLRRQLEGDLDNIILKALRKEPERRYRSVEQFSEDIRRHLDGLPVTARSDTLVYRTEKFVRRHTAFVASAMLVTLSLVAGITFTWREAQVAKTEKARAVRRFNNVRDLARSNLFELFSALQQLPGSASAQHLAVQSSLKYLDELNTETAGDRDLIAELSNAYEKIGDIQGAYRGIGIGDSKAALESYRKAFRLQQSLSRKPGNDRDATRNHSALMRKYVRCLILTGKTAEASAVASSAVAIAESLAQQHPADPGVLADLAQAHLRLASVMGGSGSSSSSTRQILDAMQHDRKAIDILTRLARPDDPAIQSQITHAELSLGFHLSKARQFIDSGRVIDSATASERARIGSQPGDLNLFYNLRGLLFERQGDQKQAMAQYRLSLPLAQTLAAADSHSLDAQLGLEIAKAHVAMQQARMGDPLSGLAGVNNAASKVEQLYAADPSASFYRNLLTVAYAYQAEILSAMAENEKALARYGRALRVAEDVISADPMDLESQLSLAKLHAATGVVLSRQRRFSDAQRELAASLINLQKLIQIRPQDDEALFVASTAHSYLAKLERCIDHHPCPAAAHLDLPTPLN